jgi:hypothetical protein
LFLLGPLVALLLFLFLVALVLVVLVMLFVVVHGVPCVADGRIAYPKF